MSEQLIEAVNLVDIKGVPSFIFTTNQLDRLKNLLSLFPLTLLTMDVHTFSKMPLSPDIVIPDDASLRIEFSLDDVQSGQLLWDMYIPADHHIQMANLNLQTKTLNIGIRDLASGKNFPIPGKQNPYILDWSGTGGLIFAIRMSQNQYERGWDHDNALDIIKGAQDEIGRLGGYVTGLHAHLGLVYREIGEFEKAKQCYMQEIRGARRQDGTFAQSAMLGFNNLAVIYKKEQAFQKAIHNFRFALALNPNYFQALISVSGLINDLNESLVYLGRAYRLQSENPIWNTILQNISTAYELSAQEVYDKIYAEAEKADLEKPLVNKAILKRIRFI